LPGFYQMINQLGSEMEVLCAVLCSVREALNFSSETLHCGRRKARIWDRPRCFAFAASGKPAIPTTAASIRAPCVWREKSIEHVQLSSLITSPMSKVCSVSISGGICDQGAS
jgi:hypothetical protein